MRGNFKLSSRGWCKGFCKFRNMFIVKVEAGDSIPGFGMFRFLLNLLDFTLVTLQEKLLLAIAVLLVNVLNYQEIHIMELSEVKYLILENFTEIEETLLFLTT